MAIAAEARSVLPIIGSGEYFPHVLSVPSGQTLITLSPGESIHAIDISPNGNNVAIGTKSGEEATFSLLDARNGCAIKIANTAPILSVKFVGNQRIAATCISGKLLLARPPYKATEIFSCPGDETVGGLVCAEDLLIGVSESGYIVCWDLETFRVERYRGVTPPRPMAWAKGEYWSAAGVVAFPGEGGRLVFFDIVRKTTSSIPAHCGDFFAITVIEDKLWTFGANDARAVQWGAAPLVVEREISTPFSVVGVARSVDLTAPLVLLFEDGSVQPYADDGDALRPHGELLTGDYRSIVGVSAEDFQTLRKCEAKRRIEQLSGRVNESLQSGDFAELEKLLDQLRDLGRRDIALAAEAEHARLSGDIILELETRLELANALPDLPSSVPALQRHSRLLEDLGQFAEAEKTLWRACAIDDSKMALREELACIRRVVHLLEHSIGILAPQELVRPRDLVLAAKVLGTTINLPIVLGQSEPFECPDCLLEPAQFVTLFNENQGSIGDYVASCACVQACLLSWPYAEKLSDFVMITSPSEHELGVGFGLQFQHNHHKTVVPAFLLFLPSTPVIASGHAIKTMPYLDRLEEIRKSGSTRAWIETVSRNATAALHKLSNITLNSQWKNRSPRKPEPYQAKDPFGRGSAERGKGGEKGEASTVYLPAAQSRQSR